MRVILQTSWDVVYLSGFFSFVIYFQYSIFTTIMYTYMTKMNPDITPTIFGITVTIQGIGHFIGAMVAGYWTKQKYKTKRPLLVGHALMLLANILFILSDHVPLKIFVAYFMMGRLIGGLGMGNVSTLRTAITAHSMDEDRARAMSVFIGGRTVGLILGPGVQFIFLLLGDDGFNLIGSLSIHSHNAGAYVSIVLNAASILALLIFYQEVERNGSRCSQRSMEVYENYPRPDKIAMFVCMITRYTQSFTYYGLETLAPAFIMMMYNIERNAAVGTMSAMFFISGVVAITLYTVFIFTDYSKNINIGKSNTVALILFIVYLLLTYQWPFLSQTVTANRNGTQGGCDYQNDGWCWGLTKTSQELFYLGYIVVFGGCFPIINVGDATLYSKLFNPVEQAIEQSLYDVSFIFSRVVTPVLCTAVYTWFGPRRVWEILILQLLIVTILWVGFAKRMVPLRPLPRPIFYLG